MTGGGLGGGVAAGAGALGMARFAAFGGRVLDRAGFAGDLGADGRTVVGGEAVRRMAGCGGLVGEPGVGWLDFALESGGLQG